MSDTMDIMQTLTPEQKKVVEDLSRNAIMDFMARDKKDKVIRYRHLNKMVRPHQILFVGSSLMEQFPIYELLLDQQLPYTIYNRGIGGYTTQELLATMDDCVYDLQPDRIFINIGTNDLNAPDYTEEGLIARYREILDGIKEHLPQAEIFMMAYYPVNPEVAENNPYMKEALKVRTNARVTAANAAVAKLAEEIGATFINCNAGITDEKGQLKAEYTIEGMHMYGDGYAPVLEALLRRGARLAEPGEFTRRAFLNGRIDLSRAEAVMGLIEARGEQERRAAVRQMAGGTADFIRRASDELYLLQAGLAACIDYPEEISDAEGAGSLRQGLDRLLGTLRAAVDERSARLIHDGMRVTLFGVPNAGKSSLLNALIGQEKAIVTEIPGTTRDTVEGDMTLDGVRVHLTDTAGMRNTEDPIERIGVERSEKARQSADIAVLVLDGSREMTADERAWISQMNPSDLAVVNKSDLQQQTTEETVRSLRPEIRCVTVSALDSESLRPVRDFLRESAEVGDNLAVTQPRHLDAVKRAISHLEDALKTLDTYTPDLAATDLQAAQNALSEITGDRADEKLLDAVFSTFCVGK